MQFLDVASKVVTIVLGIASLLAFLSDGDIVFSQMHGLLFIAFLVSLTIAVMFNERVRYCIKKHLSYLKKTDMSYRVEDMKGDMKHINNNERELVITKVLISKVSNLSAYTSGYNFDTKDTKIFSLLKSVTHIDYNYHDGFWENYILVFPNVGVGAERPIKLLRNYPLT